MRIILGLLLLASCAHESIPREQKPAWVEGIKSGEESLKVTQGNKTFYRRIAGSPYMPRESACALAITSAEEDIKKEYPHFAKIPYSLEVIFYDEEKQDCAVTVSVDKNLSTREEELKDLTAKSKERKRDLSSQSDITSDDAAEILVERSETAASFALTGLTRLEFEKFTKQPVLVNNDSGYCEKSFRTTNYSIHGNTQVCWKGENVVGYCTTKDGLCWTRTP